MLTPLAYYFKLGLVFQIIGLLNSCFNFTQIIYYRNILVYQLVDLRLNKYNSQAQGPNFNMRLTAGLR